MDGASRTADPYSGLFKIHGQRRGAMVGTLKSNAATMSVESKTTLSRVHFKIRRSRMLAAIDKN